MNDIRTIWHHSTTKDDKYWWKWQNDSIVYVQMGIINLKIPLIELEENYGDYEVGQIGLCIVGYDVQSLKMKDLHEE